jgi:hypothetical protein
MKMRGLLSTAFLLAAVLAVATAHGSDMSEREQEALDRGRPFVEVTADPDGSSGVIRAAIEVASPQSVVWAVMTNCDLALRMVDRLKTCRVLERDPQGRWDIREEVTKMSFTPSVRTVYREDFEPIHRMSFHRTGGDLKVFEGMWTLEPHGEGVRVTYEARVAAPFSVPGWVSRLVLRHDVPMALLALRREALARAPQAQ